MGNSTHKAVNQLDPDNWIDNYSDALYRFALLRVSDVELARDLVQDTFLSAWKAKDGFKGNASEKTWLFTICRNKIIDHYRKAANTLEQYGFDDYGAEHFMANGHWGNTGAPADWGISYNGQAVETKEFYKILNECKDRLKELQQAVFVMKYMDDMDSAEICKVLNITSSNYWVLMHRAKLQLRSCLEQNWFVQ